MASKWDLTEEHWIDIAIESLEFIQDPDAVGLILYRFQGQYLGAITKARTPDHTWKAWNAFHAYLTSRESRRKNFTLSDSDADKVILLLTNILELPPYTLPDLD